MPSDASVACGGGFRNLRNVFRNLWNRLRNLRKALRNLPIGLRNFDLIECKAKVRLREVRKASRKENRTGKMASDRIKKKPTELRDQLLQAVAGINGEAAWPAAQALEINS